MRRAMNRLARTLAILSVIPMGAAIASDYTIDCHTTTGGEMFSAGGDFELSGTSGQPDAGILAGGNFELGGGFWPSVEAFCFGDIDGDRDVDLGDLARLLSSYGMTSGAVYGDGDLDADGDVDLSDLAGLLSAYGTICL